MLVTCKLSAVNTHETGGMVSGREDFETGSEARAGIGMRFQKIQ
jgi:hypothetical protein